MMRRGKLQPGDPLVEKQSKLYENSWKVLAPSLLLGESFHPLPCTNSASKEFLSVAYNYLRRAPAKCISSFLRKQFVCNRISGSNTYQRKSAAQMRVETEIKQRGRGRFHSIG